MKRNPFLLFVLLSVNLSLSFSQIQYPSNIKWIEIKSQHFKIVCPEEIGEKGQEAANLLENVYGPISSSLKKPAKPISLILNNQSVISNGYVTLAPRYMSWYITPMQDASMSLDGSEWFQNLSLHEFRHVVQFDKLDTNLTDIASDLFGDFGKAILMNISTPKWFFEGDAVYSETINSLGGRGILPAFTRDFMTIEKENKRYPYDKAYLGSYRDYIPNHYKLGYIISSHVNKNYGTETWNYVLNTTSKYAYSPIIFSASLKTSTGYNLDKAYINSLNEYDSLYNISINTRRNIDYGADTINATFENTWTNYTYPFEINPKHFISLKNGLSDISTLVSISNGKENYLTEISEIDRIHSNGKKVVWSSIFSDIRWGQKEYADIIVLDIISKNQKRLTKNQKYFAPAISPSGKKIAAIEYTSSMQCSLVIIDADNGNVLSKYTSATGEFLRMPSWSDDEKQITLTGSKGQLKSLIVFDIETNLFRSIITTTENITNPVFYSNYILLNSARGDFDEIHAIDTISKKRFCAITGKYGVYNPAVNLAENSVAYQSYTINGFIVERAEINTSKWIELTPDFADYKNYLFSFLPEGESSFIVPELSADTIFGESRYSPLLHSIKIHSWSPVYNYKAVGFQVFSNDYLSTTSVKAGAVYYPDDAAFREFLTLSYAGMYPIISAEFSYGQNFMSDTTKETTQRKLNEKLIDVNITLPFNFSGDVFNTNLNIDAGLINAWQHYAEDTAFYLSNRTVKLTALYGGAEFIRHKQKSLRDIQPAFGQEFTFNYLQSTGKSGYKGSRFVTEGSLYSPGIIRHHSIKLVGGYQHYSGNIYESMYLTETDLLPVRGYDSYIAPNFIKGTISYTFPLFYPDFNIPSIFFCKRIYSSLFFDNGFYQNKENKLALQSVGVDLNFNFHLFRFLPIEFDMGVRYSRRFYDNKNSFELLLFGLAF